MKEGVPKPIKTFSKEHHQEKRDAAAREIKTKREEYFHRKKELEERVHEYTRVSEEKRQEESTVVQDIHELEEILAHLKQSRVSRLLRYFKKKEIEKIIEEQGESKKMFEQARLEAQEAINQAKRQIDDDHSLKEAKEILATFYATQKEAWDRYLEEQEERNVSAVMKEYDVVFVHGIHPRFTPRGGGSALDREEVDWKTKCQLLISLEPTISTSTIRKGERFARENMFARMGVIIKGGSVESAHTADVGTQAVSLKEREYGGHGKEIRRSIEQAIVDKDQGVYNELVVRDPKVFGFYLSFDESEENQNRFDLLPENVIREFTDGIGMPLYLLKDGEIHERDEEGELKQIDRNEIFEREFAYDPKQRKEVLERLLEESPYKPSFFGLQEEEWSLKAVLEGGKDYLKLNVREVAQKLNKDKLFHSDLPEDDRYTTTDGSPSYLLAEPFGKKGNLYILKDGKVFEREAFREHKDRKTGTWREVREGDGITSPYFGKDEQYPTTLPQGDNEGYIAALEKSIHEKKHEHEEVTRDIIAIQEGKILLRTDESGMEKIQRLENTKKSLEHLLKNYAFKLYAFGEQAKEFGNDAMQQQAIEAARDVIPHEEYEAFVEKRVSKAGRLKITPEDMERGGIRGM